MIKLLLKPFRFISHILNYTFNYLQFKLFRISYSSFPKINGRLYVYNKGEVKIGISNIFNSSIRSNFVGIKKQCTIGVTKNGKLIIGDNCGFTGVSILCAKEIIIGNNVLIGGNVSIWDTDFHSLNYLERRENYIENVIEKKIVIKDDVFIGGESIILKGVSIGCRSIIGAGSVVTKNIGDDEIWGGNPAKFIRKIVI